MCKIDFYILTKIVINKKNCISIKYYGMLHLNRYQFERRN
ncbi:uncharacterized protein Dmul_21470 [Desulfococcus multivorans]|nr:uncharacterized protein Dmul_21470 [Desulfococcus multivorans]